MEIRGSSQQQDRSVPLSDGCIRSQFSCVQAPNAESHCATTFVARWAWLMRDLRDDCLLGATFSYSIYNRELLPAENRRHVDGSQELLGSGAAPP